MIEFMTNGEVRERLKRGEDPIDLVIEKWERIVEAEKHGLYVSYDDVATGCAFCRVHAHCGECPYSCKGNTVYAAYWHHRSHENAQAVLDSLKELKDG